MSKKATSVRELERLSNSKVANEFDSAAKKGVAKASKSAYAPCYETHPPLPLGEEIVVYGGSCMHPIITDADIYIGHDHSMEKSLKAYPWNEGESFQFLIPDMGVPANSFEYIKMLEWVCVQLTAKKKVHVGCIGGHGRTGTTLAALTFLMLGEKDAVTYVRENYCKKAVESTAQMEFLNKHFDITKIAPTKGGHVSYGPTNGHQFKTFNPAPQSDVIVLGQGTTIYPTAEASCVWGKNIEIVKAKNT